MPSVITTEKVKLSSLISKAENFLFAPVKLLKKLLFVYRAIHYYDINYTIVTAFVERESGGEKSSNLMESTKASLFLELFFSPFCQKK